MCGTMQYCLILYESHGLFFSSFKLKRENKLVQHSHNLNEMRELIIMGWNFSFTATVSYVGAVIYIYNIFLCSTEEWNHMGLE